MKKLILTLILFSITAGAGEYHLRVLIPTIDQYQTVTPFARIYNSSRQVIIVNGIQQGQYANIPIYFESPGSHGHIILNTSLNSQNEIAFSWYEGTYYIPAFQDSTHVTAIPYGGNDEYRDGVRLEITIEIRYNAVSGSGNEWGEHDRIIDPVQFIDLEGDGIVGYQNIYLPSVDPKTYATSTLYHSDNNNDGNVDFGELFTDSAGQTGASLAVDDTPIRDSLPSSGDDENEDEEEEQTLEDLLADNEELQALKDNLDVVDLDPFDVSEQDLQFTVDVSEYGVNWNYTFNGFDSLGEPVPTIKLLLRSIIILIFSVGTIMAVLERLGQW